MTLLAPAAMIVAYLLGSISFAVIFSHAFMKKDVRRMGSGNAGTTNVMRNAGVLPGVLTFVCDAAKGFLAAYAGKIAFDYIGSMTDAAWAQPIYGAYLCGLICMVGHVFPIFYQFKGGKGVATSVGIFAVCCPKAILLGLCVFALFVLLTRIVSLSSLVSTVVVITASLIFADKSAGFTVQAVLSIMMGVCVILKHMENMKRLINGTESKIGGKKNG